MTLTFILVESALELVPKQLWNHPSVRAWCKRFNRHPSEAILDVNYMRAAMTDLPDAHRRGRPDIVHYFLLTVLESPAGKKGLVDVYVHTYDGKMFYVEPKTRIPRSYNRFTGIVSRVLMAEDTPRLHPVDAGPVDIIKMFKKEGVSVVGMAESGDPPPPEDHLAEDALVLIGGFQRGEFMENYGVERWLSIGEESYPAWVVGAEVVAGWERRFYYKVR